MKQSLHILFLMLLAFAFATVSFAQEAISVGDTVEGEADGEDVEYEIELAEGETIEISLESADFDTYLIVLDEDGDEVAEDDDGGDDRNSLLEFTADADGTYTIVVTAFGGGDNAEGDFELSIEGADGGEEDVEEDVEEDDDSGSSGGSGEGDLAYGDSTDFDVDGEDELEVTFEGAAGDAVTIIASSSEDQDLIIQLLNPDGDEIALFDQFTFGDAALIRVPLEDDGVYTIVIKERNDEELIDEIEVELIETEILNLNEGPQTTLVTSAIGLDYMVFEAAENEVYLIFITLDDDIDSPLDINVYEESDDRIFADTSLGMTNIEQALFIFEASEDGLVTLELEYFAFFDSEIEVTIEIELQEE